MSERTTSFVPVTLSLSDLLGDDYIQRVCEAKSWFTGASREELEADARRGVELYPTSCQARVEALLGQLGTQVVPPANATADGASTHAYSAATKRDQTPINAFGPYRIGEGGRLQFILKSEHYHSSLGHAFPGFELLAIARQLGIPNATHNNTRGHVTRLLEERLVTLANGTSGHLSRVLNLQSGSLACEAALKLALGRFYPSMTDSDTPPHGGKVPVFIVLGDADGGLAGNYHGTCVTAQILRGMWPTLRGPVADIGMFRVRPVKPNDMADLEAAFAEATSDGQHPAAFISELIMMNYGSIRLSDAFIQRAYELSRVNDCPTIVDEIQSCLWSPEVFLFREYGVEPDMLVLGKGMSGGEYAASRLVFSEHLDRLPQFGALVTNGQEEIASLAYLIAISWLEANAAVVTAVGEHYEAQMRELASQFPTLIQGVDGKRHLSALTFHDLALAKTFVKAMGEAGFDISVQAYKSTCPPAALTKPPITTGYAAVETIISQMGTILRRF